MAEQADRAPSEQHSHHDPVAGRIGMWLFLFTEVLLFGTLFIAYAVYLNEYRPAFSSCSRELHLALGATNTVILLTSSLFVALAIAALARGRTRLSVGLLALTVACAAAFLVIKYFEWTEKFHHGIYPGSRIFEDRAQGDAMFYSLYFVMTGLHALHVLVGMAVIAVVGCLVVAGKIHRERSIVLENTGLYWHLVDIIWIYLFPVFYLIR
jgi:cytochrome c oxidase subunit III